MNYEQFLLVSIILVNSVIFQLLLENCFFWFFQRKKVKKIVHRVMLLTWQAPMGRRKVNFVWATWKSFVVAGLAVGLYWSVLRLLQINFIRISIIRSCY